MLLIVVLNYRLEMILISISVISSFYFKINNVVKNSQNDCTFYPTFGRFTLNYIIRYLYIIYIDVTFHILSWLM